jgi:glutaconate CoA-transferase subunit A
VPTVPVIGLAEAVARWTSPGSCVYIGNFGTQLFAVGHEIVRQHRHGLHLVVGSGGLLMDQLIGAGAVDRVTFSHCWNPVGPAPTYSFRRAAENAEPPELVELSLGMLSAALQAAAWNVPFLPVQASPNSGYVADRWAAGLVDEVESAFGPSLVVAALRPNVAFIHADLVDDAGNAWLDGPLGESVQAAAAADTTVIIAEEQCSREQLRKHGATIPGLITTAVVIAPGSAKPDGTTSYPRSTEDFASYTQATRTAEGFHNWVGQLRGQAR